MAEEKRGLAQRVRPNAEWELIKWGWAAVRSAVISFGYWSIQRVRHIHVDWIGLSILFALCMILGYLLFPLRRARLKTDSDKRAEDKPEPSINEAAKGFANQENLKTYIRTGVQSVELFSPLQMEAFQLAHDLRKFFAGLDPFPESPKQEPGESLEDYLVRMISVGRVAEAKWGQKLAHGYANRGFGQKITSLMHRVGEEFEYPAYVPNYAETIVPTKDAIPKLAQQMEMIAIWINRKQAKEVDLLHPK